MVLLLCVKFGGQKADLCIHYNVNILVTMLVTVVVLETATVFVTVKYLLL